MACEQAHSCEFGKNILAVEPTSRSPRVMAKNFPRARTSEPACRLETERVYMLLF